ncbi:MAG: hypothetical protein ABSG13_16270 [Bryobacteraceae bacterium]|jgi:hypothetical protein
MLARARPYILLFLALTVVYHANLRPVDSGDTLPGSLIPFSVILDHTIFLDRFAPWLRGHVWYTSAVIHEAHGHFFSSFPIAGPLLVSPLYLPMAFLGRRDWDPALLVLVARIAQKFAAAAIAALSAVLLLLLLKRITTARWAWCLTLVYALATETWSISSQALWQHGPGELALIGCFYGLERWSEDRERHSWSWLCGACAAAAFVIRPTNLVLLPALVVALLLAKTTLAEYVRLLAVPLVGGALLAGYNLYVFQRLSGGYAVAVLYGSAFPGLAGLFLSPGRGLLIYTPVIVFAFCAFLPGASISRRQHKVLLEASIFFIIFESIVMSRSVIWWGGYSWGPRLLTELIPPLIVLMAIGVSAIDHVWPRRAFAVLAVYSVLIQAVGVFFYPNGHWDGTPRSVDGAPARLWDWNDSPIARTLRGGLYWEPYAVVGAALTRGIPAARLRLRQMNVNPYEQAEPAKVPRTDPGLP